jgi:hypothetical protein
VLQPIVIFSVVIYFVKFYGCVVSAINKPVIKF